MTAAVLELDRIRRNALKAIREGRVNIRSVAYPDSQTRRASAAGAFVYGHRGTHEVSFMHDDWRCTCPDGSGCAHVLALMLVTGHAGDPIRAVPADEGHGTRWAASCCAETATS